MEYRYILGDFKTDPWNASDLPGIKSAYQLRVSRYDEEGKELREGNVFMQDHPCYCANCLNFKFSQCEYVQITGGNKMHFVMKQIVAEGSNRDSTYFGKLFHFYQTDGQPLVQKKPIIVRTRSLSLEGVDAYENPVPLFALLRKVYDRQADADGVRSGSYFMDVQLLVRVSNADVGKGLGHKMMYRIERITLKSRVFAV